MDDLISVIVSTYNRPDALDVALRSLSRQSDRRFEIVVADDGSGAATERVVRDWTARAPVAVKHVWHDDRGFRLAEIRNPAIRKQRIAPAACSSRSCLRMFSGTCVNACRHFQTRGSDLCCRASVRNASQSMRSSRNGTFF